MGCGADTEADDIYDVMLDGEDVTLPPIDFDDDIFKIPDEVLASLIGAVHHLDPTDVTNGTISGPGIFDLFMRGYKAHLKEEYSAGRISGAEYTKAYIAITESAMTQGVAFLVQKDQAYWAAINAQLSALTARTQFETAKMQLANAKFEALTSKSTYALQKLKLANESIQYCINKYNLDNLLPAELAQRTQQTDNLETEGAIQQYNLDNILPQNLARSIAEVELLGVNKDTAEYNLNEILPIQKLGAQEQMEAQRGQTMDTRSDGVTPITGSIGKQKELYTQQITSYQRDSEVKSAKFWTDAWITMKTIDEGLDPPDAFTNTNLDQVLQHIATNNGFGTMS